MKFTLKVKSDVLNPMVNFSILNSRPKYPKSFTLTVILDLDHSKFFLKFDIKSVNHLNLIKFTLKVESGVLNPMINISFGNSN